MEPTCTRCTVRMNGKRMQEFIWCPECEDMLCTACSNLHKSTDGTREHHSVPYADYCNLPQIIKTVRLYCEQHAEKYTKFCIAHDVPLCAKCLHTSHKKCSNNVKNVDEIMLNSEIDHVDITVNETHKKIHRESKATRDLIKKLNKIRRDLKIDAQKWADHLIACINEIKMASMSHIDNIVNGYEEKETKNLKLLNEYEHILKEVWEKRFAIRQYASRFQKFISLNSINNIVRMSKDLIVESSQRENEHIELKFEANTEIDEILRQVKSFGNVVELNRHRESNWLLDVNQGGAKKKNSNESAQKERLNKVSPTAHNIHNPQSQVAKQAKQILRRRLELLQELTVSGYDHGKTYWVHYQSLPDGAVALSGRFKQSKASNFIVIVNKDGSLISRMKTDSLEDHRDLIMFDQNQLALLTGEYKISLIDVRRSKILLSVTCNKVATRIASFTGDILYLSPNVGIIRFNLVSKIETIEVEDFNANEFSFITVRNDKVFYIYQALKPNIGTSVDVLDITFNIISKTTLDSIEIPCGLAFDEIENMYVLAKTGPQVDSTMELYCLSLSSKKCSKIWSLRNTRHRACAHSIHFDAYHNHLVVLLDNGAIYQYRVILHDR